LKKPTGKYGDQRAGCGLQRNEYAHLLQRDPKIFRRAKRRPKCTDIIGNSRRLSLGRTQAAHTPAWPSDSCHLQQRPVVVRSPQGTALTNSRHACSTFPESPSAAGSARHLPSRGSRKRRPNSATAKHSHRPAACRRVGHGKSRCLLQLQLRSQSRPPHSGVHIFSCWMLHPRAIVGFASLAISFQHKIKPSRIQ